MAQAGLISHYEQLCRDSGQQPNEQIMSILNQSRNIIPAECSYPVTTLCDEIEFFNRKAAHLDGSSLQTDKEQCQRARIISTYLQNIQNTIDQDPIDKFDDFLRLIEQLRAVTPEYTRLEQVFGTFAVEFARTLPGCLNNQLCKKQLKCLRQSTYDQINYVLTDERFQIMAKLCPPLQDLQTRVRISQQVFDAINSIKKCLTETQLSNISYPELFFSCPRDEFDQFIQQTSNMMSSDEQRTAHFIEEIINSSQNLASAIPVLGGVRNALKRPQIKRRLQDTEQRLRSRIQDTFNEMEADLMDIGRQIGQMAETELEVAVSDLVAAMQLLKRHKMTLQQLYNTFQAIVTDVDQFQAEIKLLADKIKVRESEVIRKMVRVVQQIRQKPVLIFNQQGQLEVQMLHDITQYQKLYQILLMNNQAQQLGPEPLAVLETLQNCLGSLATFQNVSDFYNSLSSTIKIYQKPLLVKAAAFYEQELRKCCAATGQQISTNKQYDSAFVQKLQKVAAYAQQVTDQLKVKIDKLEEFHAQQMELYRQLSRVSLSNQQFWLERVAELNGNFGAFLKLIPAELQDVLLVYWTGGLCKIMCQKYFRALGNDLAQLKPLARPIVVRSDMTLDPPVQQVQTYLINQIAAISRLPADSRFQLSGKPYIAQMHQRMVELSAQYLPQAVDNVQSICANLYALQDYFARSCGVVAVAQSRDFASAGEKLATYGNCRALFEYSKILGDEDNVTTKLLAEFTFLQERQDEKNIFTVAPSGGSVLIDVQTAVRLFALRRQAVQEVALQGAAALGLSTVGRMESKISDYSQQLQEQMDSASSSEQFKKLAENLAEIQRDAKKQLRDDSEELKNITMLLNERPQGFEDKVQRLGGCINSYQQLITNLEDVNNKLEEKKQDMYKQFQQRLAGPDGLINRSQKVQAQMDARIEQVLQYIERVMKVQPIPAPEDANILFTQLYAGNFELKDLLNKQLADFELTNKVALEIQEIDAEVHSFFDKSYLDMLSPAQQKVFTDAMQKTQMFTFLTNLYKFINPIEAALSKLFRMEWNIFKVNQHEFEELNSLIDDLHTQIKDQQPPPDLFEEQQQIVQQSLALMKKYQQFMGKLVSFTQQLLRQLRSNSLQKNHWMEISDRLHLMAACKYFGGQNVAGHLPDLLNGCVLFYTVAANLFSSPTFIISDQVSQEYKKMQQYVRDVLARAESESAVRVAIEEVSYWLREEARVSLTTHELSPVSQEETSRVVRGLRSVPLAGQWRPLLVALAEKKAVLQSVVSSPHAKPLRGELDDASQQVEALTRAAHVMGELARQVAVLEPVMGRRVLPEQHDRFYAALRAVCHVVCQCVGEEQHGALQEPGGRAVPLLATALVRQPVPAALRLPAGPAARAADDAPLGGYKDAVLTLEAASGLLAGVQAALRAYLEAKRLVFPRFYFLADQDVLEILANANSRPAETLAPHVKKLFNAVEALVIDDGRRITHFSSAEGEVTALRCPVHVAPETPPELWLNRLDLSIKETLKAQCMAALGLGRDDHHDVNRLGPNDSFQINTSHREVEGSASPYTVDRDSFYVYGDLQPGISRGLDVGQCSGEMLCLAQAVQFTAQVDEALAQRDADGALRGLQERLRGQLDALTARLFSPEVSGAAFGAAEYVQQLRLRALATDVTRQLAVAGELLGRGAARGWLWGREPKARVHRRSGDVYCVAVDTALAYTFEYQGLGARLVHTGLTARCYAALAAALATGRSCSPTGPAGTGKTETVKAFAARLGRPCAVFNCDAAVDREDLARLLAGVARSGSVGCFDEVNRLSPAVLSAVSADVEAVQRAIAARGGPGAAVSPFAAVFVTMNPASREYRGRAELPYSLARLLRGCWMGRADAGLIMRTALQTAGFRHAAAWARKAELAYLLASRRVPRQVHLDWGLRSLQSVIRQAAIARASLCRTRGLGDPDQLRAAERAVLVKALSDATFSRVQGRSAEIFAEILRDVFGQVQRGPEDRFGATNETEAALARNIATDSQKLGCLALQLYRALTAKLGVALLGRAASGKSEVRRLLFDAIYETSGKRLRVQEFVIAPKAMSRQDLLGHVDPATKEWSDGALTRAARAAVRLLGQEGPAVWPVVVLDGDVDPLWIEALNSSLDDNRLLSLSSGERIRFPASADPLEALLSGGAGRRAPAQVSFLFETDSLRHASPATVSRLAVILVSDPTAEEQAQFLDGTHAPAGRLARAVRQHPRLRAPAAMAEAVSHMLMCCDGPDGAAGMLRVLSSELGGLSQAQAGQLCQVLGVAAGSLAGAAVSPQCVGAPDGACPPGQVWAIRLVRQFLEAQRSVLLVGRHQSGKFYCVQQASSHKDQFQLVSLACTQLTTREDIIRTIRSQCGEYQRPDGVREIRPRSGKKLLVCIRNVDVGQQDEYGHTEIYTLLWSIVAHGKLFLHQGNQVELKNIILACTAENYQDVPERLRRLMGVVNVPEISHGDAEVILGQFYSISKLLNDSSNFTKYLQTAVQEHEKLKILNQQIKQEGDRAIALPNLLSLLRNINFSLLVRFGREKIDENTFIMLAQYFYQCQFPLLAGQEAILADLKRVSKLDLQNNFLTFQRAGETSKNVGKYLQNGDPIKEGQKQPRPECVSAKVRMNMLRELLGVAQDSIPGLRLFSRFLDNSPSDVQQSYLRYISALEMGLTYQRGLVVVSRPGAYSVESLVAAALTRHHHIVFAACDQFGGALVRRLCMCVASGHAAVAYVVDTPVLEHDAAHLAFAAAVASGDTGYVQSRLSAADMRAVLARYQEACGGGADATEAELAGEFLARFAAAVRPVLLVSPESALCDRLLQAAPPIRRGFQVVSFALAGQSPRQPGLVAPTIRGLCPGFKEAVSFASPKHFVLYGLFADLWRRKISQTKLRLSAGLKQLSAAQREVDGLAKQAAARQQKVQQAQDEANRALEQITAKMQTVQQNKDQAKKIEAELRSKEGNIFDEKVKAEKELEQVKPLLEEAKSAVSNIPNDAISEVKSFNSPPQAVQLVLEAVILFMGGQDTSWKSIRSFIGQPGITRQIASLDINNVPIKIMQRVEKHVKANPQAFDQATISRVSRAAAPLAKWVMANMSFATIYQKIEPLIKKCDEANKNLSDLRGKLKQINDQVAQLEKEASILKENFTKKTQDLQVYKQELEAIDIKRRKGEQMLAQLSGEKVRWTENDQLADKQLNDVSQCAQVAATLYIDYGDKTDDVRQEFAGPLRTVINQLTIEQQFRDDAQKLKLRISTQSLENAILIQLLLEQNCYSNIVLSNVTEATGVIGYLRAKYEPQFLSANDENLANLLSIAARFGQMVVITDCDHGYLPAATVPYLRYGFEGYRVSESSAIHVEDDAKKDVIDISLLKPSVTMQVPITSEKTSELNNKFRMVIVSSVGIFVPSHLRERLVQLSFAPTQKSRTDLYTDQVLSCWSPETLSQINELNTTQANLRAQLSQIEDNLLTALKNSSESKVNILDDQNLAAVLSKSYEQNQSIQQAKKQAEGVEERLLTLKGLAVRIAEVAERCLAALENIAAINELYIVDDQAVVPLLQQILNAIKGRMQRDGQISREMVEAAIDMFLQAMYQRVQNMVFADDKAGCLAILLRKTKPGLFTENMFRYFTGQQPQGEAQEPGWAEGNPLITQAAIVLGPQACQQAQFHNVQVWSGFIMKARSAKELNKFVLPEAAGSLNSLQKAVILTAVRQDMLSQLLLQACDEAFTCDSQNAAPSPLSQALELANGLLQPIIVYTAAGQDPTSNLNAQVIVLAPGKEEQANEQLKQSVQSASPGQNVIVVKGAYLCQQWLQTLPFKLANLNLSVADGVRISVILLLEPKPGFPKGLSRVSWRICLQESISPKQAMIVLLRSLVQPVQQGNQHLQQFYQAISFMVCALHTALEARRAFAPRGVAADPGWNAQDPITLMELLGRALNFREVDEEILVGRAKGYCQDVIYGVQTKDDTDLTLVEHLVDMVFHKDLIKAIKDAVRQPAKYQATDLQSNLQNLQASVEFCRLYDEYPILKYVVPPFEPLSKHSGAQLTDQFINYVNRVYSDKQSPDQLGLPGNALLTKSEKDSLLMRSILLRATGRDAENGRDGGDLYGPILGLKGVFENAITKEIEATRLEASQNPIVEELENQLQSLWQIVKVIRADLEEAKFASENPLLASEHIKATAGLIGSNICPESWAVGFSAPPTSLAPLGNPEFTTLSAGSPEAYVRMLPQAVGAIVRGAKQAAECDQRKAGGIVLDIHLLPRPCAVLEAVRRYEGLVQGVELDQVQLAAVVGAAPDGRGVQLSGGSVTLEGGALAVGIDFSARSAALPAIGIVAAARQAGRHEVGVPLYVEKGRETRTPVVESVLVEGGSERGVCVFGVYAHLTGR